MKLNIKNYIQQRAETLNWLYNTTDDELVTYIYNNTVGTRQTLKNKYYNMDNGEYESIVFDSIWTTIQNINSVQDEEQLLNYFRRTLSNNLKNKYKYQTQDKRDITKTVHITNTYLEDKVSTTATNDFEKVEILLFLEQEGFSPILIKYVELIMECDVAPTDTEVAKILNCDRRTVKRCRCVLKDKLIQTYTQ